MHEVAGSKAKTLSTVDTTPIADTMQGLEEMGRPEQTGDVEGTTAGTTLSTTGTNPTSTNAGTQKANLKGLQEGLKELYKLPKFRRLLGRTGGGKSPTSKNQNAALKDSKKNVGTDPINPTTGEFRESRHDLYLPGIGLDTSIERTYSNRVNYHGILGYSWLPSYEQILDFSDEGCEPKATWMQHDGQLVTFLQNDDVYTSEEPYELRILESPQGWHEVTATSGTRHIFDDKGQLMEIVDLHDNRLIYERYADGRPLRILDTMGRVVHFSYGAHGYLERMYLTNSEDWGEELLEVRYSIDEHGHLLAVTNPSGITEHYEYSVPTTQTYVATSQTEVACDAHCGLTPNCNTPQGACLDGGDEAVGACVDTCTPDNCASDCAQACDTGPCQSCTRICDTMDCDTLCRDEGWDAIDHELNTAASTGPLNPQHAYREACVQSCNSTCSNSESLCSGSIAFNTSLPYMIYEFIATNGLDSLWIFPFAIGGVIDLAWCAISTAEHCDFDLARSSLAAFCNNTYERCCQWGSDCPTGSCQEGRNCVDDCVELHLQGDISDLTGTTCEQIDGNTAIEVLVQECKDRIDAIACTATEVGACKSTCESTCVPSCQDEAPCQAHCQGFAIDYDDNCKSSCVNSCRSLNAGTYDPLFHRYGSATDTEHNLVSAHYGSNAPYLELRYGDDPTHPSFDRVTWQKFGDVELEFHYHDHIHPRPLSAPELHNAIDTTFQTRALCDVSWFDDGPHRVQPARLLPTLSSVQIDGEGTPWVYYNAEEGQMLARTNGSGSTVYFEYDTRGRKIGMQDARGTITCFDYDLHGNVHKTAHFSTDPTESPIESRRTFDAHGRLHEVMTSRYAGEPDAIIEEHDVDLATGLISSISYPDQTQESYHHDSMGRLETKLARNGLRTQNVYDPSSPLSHTTRVHGPEGELFESSTQVDVLGRTTESVTPRGIQTLRSWRPDGKIERIDIVYPDRTHRLAVVHAYDPHDGHLIERSSYTYRGDPAQPVDEVLMALVRFGVDAQGNLTHVEEQAGSERRHTCKRYDSRGALLEEISPAGEMTRIERDPNGAPIRIVSGVWPLQSSWAHPECIGTATTLLSREGQLEEIVQETTYDAFDTPSIIRQGDVTQTMTYDGFGRIVTTAFPNGAHKHLTHDASGRIATASLYRTGSDPEWHAQGRTQDLQAHLVASTKQTYDILGRLTSTQQDWFVDEPNGTRSFLGVATTTTEYDVATGATHLTDPLGRRTSMYIDTLGRPTRAVSSDGSEQTWDYAAHGQVTLARKPSPRGDGSYDEKTTSIKSWGALESVSSMDGWILRETPEFDELGRALVTSRDQGAMRIAYDSFGKIMSRSRITSTNQEVLETQYIRDARGRIVRSLSHRDDGTTIAHEYERDAMGRVRRVTKPNAVTENHEYVPGTSKLAQHTDALGTQHVHEYDAFGNLSLRTSSLLGRDTVRMHYEYDIDGLRRAISESPKGSAQADLELTFVRDSLGNLHEETSSLFPGEPVRYMHGLDSRLTSLNVGGHVITHTHDPAGRLEQVDLNGELLTEHRYFGHGPLSSINLGNGLTRTRAYDQNTRLVQQAWYNQQGGLVDGIMVQYGEDGLLARLDRNTSEETYSSLFMRDEHRRVYRDNHEVHGLPPLLQGEMVTASALEPYMQQGDAWRERAFDSLGNTLEWWSGNQGAGFATVDTDNRYIDHGGDAIVTDALGQTQSIGTHTHFDFDVTHQLTRAHSHGSTLDFVYDPLGRLVSWSDDTDVTYVQYAGDRVLRERTSQEDTLFVPSTTSDAPIAMKRGEELYYLHEGWGGRVDLMTSRQGESLEHYHYDAFLRVNVEVGGEGREETSPRGYRYLVGGKPYFGELGLHGFGARWYMPELERFLSQDPLGDIDGPNQYQYVGGMPMTYYDPEGLRLRSASHWVTDSVVYMMPFNMECKVRDCSYLPTIDAPLRDKALDRKGDALWGFAGETLNGVLGLGDLVVQTPMPGLIKNYGYKKPINEAQAAGMDAAFWTSIGFGGASLMKAAVAKMGGLKNALKKFHEDEMGAVNMDAAYLIQRTLTDAQPVVAGGTAFIHHFISRQSRTGRHFTAEILHDNNKVMTNMYKKRDGTNQIGNVTKETFDEFTSNGITNMFQLDDAEHAFNFAMKRTTPRRSPGELIIGTNDCFIYCAEVLYMGRAREFGGAPLDFTLNKDQFIRRYFDLSNSDANRFTSAIFK